MLLDEFFDKNFKTSLVNINGEITPARDAKISIFDRGFLYGDSIYEVTYGADHSLLFLDEHIERLYNSAKLLDMKIFYSKDEIVDQVLKTLKTSKLQDVYVRIIVSRGETEITLDPNSSFKNNLVIIVRPRVAHPLINYQKGISLFIPNTIRNDIKAVNPNAKSGNYLNNVMAMSEAKDYGADDAVMINHKSEVTEGTSFNIWIVKDKTIITPPASSGLLKGITREKLIELCKEKSLNIQIRSFGKDELLSADEVFISSSTRGIMPVRKVNENVYGNSINDWPITNSLTTIYTHKVNEEKQKNRYKY